jgi:4-hydroxy-3-methylbut-2-enyl diphosphate reductase
MEVAIDQNSGFCFGVVRAIEAAENELKNSNLLYCLGDIVHNNEEVIRLKKMGMTVINKAEMQQLKNQKMLIRAHGEPPSTYQLAKQNNISVIDATCTVVLNLQNIVRQGYLEVKPKNGQVVILGKKGHSEVVGLCGQTDDTALVVSSLEEINAIDFYKPVRLYAQTTQSLSTFKNLVRLINQKYTEKGIENPDFVWHDTICRQVSNRENSLKQFAVDHDVVIFVSGEKSSNGMVLYEICQSANPHSYRISSSNELKKEWFEDCKNAGVCGATSTPMWLMNAVAEEIKTILSK